MGAADRAVQYARNWLLATEPGSRVHDVQDDPRFQHRGVDLLWELSSGEVRGIEVKGDRQPRRRAQRHVVGIGERVIGDLSQPFRQVRPALAQQCDEAVEIVLWRFLLHWRCHREQGLSRP